MPTNPEFGRRARMRRAAMDQPPTLGEIGERVGELLGRKPFTSQAVGAWFRGQEPESFDIVAALAGVLGCEPGWLAFGEHTVAPRNGSALRVPNDFINPSEDRKLTDEEVERARRTAARGRAATPPRKRGKGA